jgi:hypothetical protein
MLYTLSKVQAHLQLCSKLLWCAYNSMAHCHSKPAGLLHSCPDVVMLQLQLLEVQMAYIDAFKGL